MDFMNAQPYTDTQLINFTALSTVQMSMQSDGPAARLKFQLTRTQSEALGALDPARIQLLSAQLPVSLFVPRAGMEQLLSAPAAIASTLAAADAGRTWLPPRSRGRRRSDRA